MSALKMVECGSCRVKNFIPGDLPPMETVPCTRCGHPVMVPVFLRHFELRSVIASGGMGTVFRAHDKNLYRDVAVKILKPEMAADPEIMASFFREARAGAGLNHTNIIHVYSFDVFEGQVFLVMELADKGSLDSWIERGGHVPELNVLDVGCKVSSALDKALQHGLLHRDIKPGNILFNAEGEPKLVDFGLAREADAGVGEENSVWGTPDYVAPEKIMRQAETFLSDMYSLGGTLYHALTGRVPFPIDHQAHPDNEAWVNAVVQAHVHSALVPAGDLNPDVSGETSEAIAKSMAKDPRDRYQSYDEFIMALELARSHVLMRQSQGEPAKQQGRWFKR